MVYLYIKGKDREEGQLATRFSIRDGVNFCTEIIKGKTLEADFLYFLVMEGYLENLIEGVYNKQQLLDMLTVFFRGFRADIRNCNVGHVRNSYSIFSMIEPYTEEDIEELFELIFQIVDWKNVERRILSNTEFLDPVNILVEHLTYDKRRGTHELSHHFVYYTEMMSEILGFDREKAVDIMKRANGIRNRKYDDTLLMAYSEDGRKIDEYSVEDVDIIIHSSERRVTMIEALGEIN